MASPLHHENAKAAKQNLAAIHSLKVAVNASDVKSVYQSGLDIIIDLHSGEQILLREARLRALTDPQ